MNYWMAEARQLKSGRWRIYVGSDQTLVRDSTSGTVVTFDSLDTARGWWGHRHPNDPPLQEAIKCARCGGYFGPLTDSTIYAGRHYHATHTPQAIDLQRRR
jgi:hypothetical protein